MICHGVIVSTICAFAASPHPRAKLILADTGDGPCVDACRTREPVIIESTRNLQQAMESRAEIVRETQRETGWGGPRPG